MSANRRISKNSSDDGAKDSISWKNWSLPLPDPQKKKAKTRSKSTIREEELNKRHYNKEDSDDSPLSWSDSESFSSGNSKPRRLAACGSKERKSKTATTKTSTVTTQQSKERKGKKERTCDENEGKKKKGKPQRKSEPADDPDEGGGESDHDDKDTDKDKEKPKAEKKKKKRRDLSGDTAETPDPEKKNRGPRRKKSAESHERTKKKKDLLLYQMNNIDEQPDEPNKEQAPRVSPGTPDSPISVKKTVAPTTAVPAPKLPAQPKSTDAPLSKADLSVKNGGPQPKSTDAPLVKADVSLKGAKKAPTTAVAANRVATVMEPASDGNFAAPKPAVSDNHFAPLKRTPSEDKGLAPKRCLSEEHFPLLARTAQSEEIVVRTPAGRGGFKMGKNSIEGSGERRRGQRKKKSNDRTTNLDEDQVKTGQENERPARQQRGKSQETADEKAKRKKKEEKAKGKKRKELLQTIVKPGEIVEDSEVPPNRFEAVEILGMGGFGVVFLVKTINKQDQPLYAMKIEPKALVKDAERLKFEVMILKDLAKLDPENQKHFCKLISRGQDYKMRFVVMELLGLCLYDIRKLQMASDFTKTTSLKICIQTLEAICDFHMAGLLHRDIKQHNFAVGKLKPDIIYIFDFGIAKRFMTCARKGKKRLPFRKNIRFVGTLKYCSIAAHDGIEQAPKDDLEAWLYMCVETLRAASLPWNKPKSIEQIVVLKKDFMNGLATSAEKYRYMEVDIAGFLPTLVSYINKLKFESDIDQSFVVDLLIEEARVNGLNLDEPFDWVEDHGNRKKEEPNKDKDKDKDKNNNVKTEKKKELKRVRSDEKEVNSDEQNDSEKQKQVHNNRTKEVNPDPEPEQEQEGGGSGNTIPNDKNKREKGTPVPESKMGGT